MSDPIKVDFSDKGKGNGKTTKEVLIPPEKSVLKIIISILITIIGGGITYYFMLPPMNFRSVDFYLFWGIVAAIFIASCVLTSKAFIKPEYIPYVKKCSIVPIIIVAALVLVLIIGYLTSCVLFRANAFSQIITVSDQADLNSSVTKIESTEEFDSVAMIDKAAADKLADKVLGDLATIGLESQFELATTYSTQINYQGSPCRVYPLQYGNIFKWLNNTNDGFPGYVIVNMNTQATSLKLLNSSGTDGYIKYSPAEHFQKNLKRIVRFEYPTALIGNISFEIDDSGTPYWICQSLEKKVGLIGGDDVKGIILVNAITGDMTYYSQEEIVKGMGNDSISLAWIDQVYDANLLVQQYNYFGTYNNGFWNSVFGQTGVKKTTTGSSYIAMDDDVYIYTGVTSVSSDQSILGFVLINQRTKEAKFYSTTGATELAAENSAEGVLSDKGWIATFPLLINLDGEATYFMALKDSSDVVKSYAMVNVSNYNIVAADDADGNPNLVACIKNYSKALKDSKKVTINVDTTVVPEIVTNSGIESVSDEAEKDITVTGKITVIKSQIESGSTCYYIGIEGSKNYIKVAADSNPEAIFYSVGQTITVTYKSTDVSGTWIEGAKIKVTETTTAK